ncbi:MAG: carboxypeptidase-like regulatory domain-containing protein [Acidobacteriales bacterium]|nr:carboxypeptidase-like regulatory domain-containing protein [Terriglobales bacterium]
MRPNWLVNVNAAKAASVLLVPAPARAPKTQVSPSLTGGLRGEVYTQGTGHERTPIPGARLRIQSIEAGGPAIDARTDEAGRFSAVALVAGRYCIATEFAGLQAADTEVIVQAGRDTEVEIELQLASVQETITVSAQAEEVDTSETDSKAVLRQPVLRRAPNVNERFEGLLPWLPGVVRGPGGLINIKGARASQGGTLLNSANVTEFERFRFQVQNLMPRMPKRDGMIVGVGSSTPRATLTSSQIRERAALTQSFEYRYVRTPVETLPPQQCDTRVKSFDSYAQLDLNLTERQNTSVAPSLYPQKLNYLGLNTFTPQPATPDLNPRGYFLAFLHKFVSPSGSPLASQVSVKELNSNFKAHSNDLYRLAVEATTGGFFNRQDRDTNRFEWREVFTPPATHGCGRHELKTGSNFVRYAYGGRQAFSPVEVLRASGSPAERIAFAHDTTVSIMQRERTAFVLNKWTIHSGMALDAGFRLDYDSISDEGHVVPRLGFAIAPFHGSRTVLRGGAGYFYDRSGLSIPTFPFLPERTVLRYLSDGSAPDASLYRHETAGPIVHPRSTAWKVGMQHEVFHNLVLRTSHSRRNAVRGFFIEPVQRLDAGALILSNAGRNRYREFQVTSRYQIRCHVLNESYVRSSAIGDLSDLNQFLGNTPVAVIRPNERGPLPSDAPHRVLLWGHLEVPWKITLAPVLDAHTGSPYSVAEEERDFIGGRNRADASRDSPPQIDKQPKKSHFRSEGGTTGRTPGARYSTF